MNVYNTITKSLCPECKKVLQAEVYEQDGKIWMNKTCPQHGEFTDLYWGDNTTFFKFLDYLVTDKGFPKPITHTKEGCPWDCGVCDKHPSGTCLVIVDVTNRCNMNCPICFANSNSAGYVYEPTFKQIKEMLIKAKEVNPAPLTTVQFSGGEPTLREDLPELISLAKNLGYTSVYINTNGIRLSKSVDYCKKLIDAGLERIYLQFDGVTPQPYMITRGFNALPIKLKAVENMRKAGLRSTGAGDKAFFLVVTVAKGVNDYQLGDIIRYCAENKDLVKVVNFQQISFMGRIPMEELKQKRITTPDCFYLVEEQTGGEIRAEDYFPYAHISRFLHFYFAWKNKGVRYKNPSCHPHCGSHALIYVDGNHLIPYNKFLDIAGLTKFFEEQAQLLDKGVSKLKISYNFITHISKFIHKEYLPSDLSMSTLLNCVKEIVLKGDSKSLNRLNENTITVSNMHFMDLYNFDLERVKRCIVHYVTPDGRLIPFCTYNNFYREKIEKMFAQTVETVSVGSNGHH